MHDVALAKDPHVTLAHHTVPCSSVVIASDWITEGLVLESHLELGFFLSFQLMLSIIIILSSTLYALIHFALINFLQNHGCECYRLSEDAEVLTDESFINNHNQLVYVLICALEAPVVIIISSGKLEYCRLVHSSNSHCHLVKFQGMNSSIDDLYYSLYSSNVTIPEMLKDSPTRYCTTVISYSTLVTALISSV